MPTAISQAFRSIQGRISMPNCRPEDDCEILRAFGRVPPKPTPRILHPSRSPAFR